MFPERLKPKRFIPYTLLRAVHGSPRRNRDLLLRTFLLKNVYNFPTIDMIVNVGIWFTPGLIVVPFMLLASFPIVRALWQNPLTPECRLQAMPQALSVNVVYGAFYAASILASSQVVLVF